MSKENKSQKIENRETLKKFYKIFNGIIKAEDASQINHILINYKTKGGGMTNEQLGKMITDLAGVVGNLTTTVEEMGETLGKRIDNLELKLENVITKNNLIT